MFPINRCLEPGLGPHRCEDLLRRRRGKQGGLSQYPGHFSISHVFRAAGPDLARADPHPGPSPTRTALLGPIPPLARPRMGGTHWSPPSQRMPVGQIASAGRLESKTVGQETQETPPYILRESEDHEMKSPHRLTPPPDPQVPLGPPGTDTTKWHKTTEHLLKNTQSRN